MSRDHIIKVFWADVKNLDFILSAEETQESRDRVCLKALALAAGWGALAGMEAGGHRSLKVRQSPVRADTWTWAVTEELVRAGCIQGFF